MEKKDNPTRSIDWDLTLKKINLVFLGKSTTKN
jgi:hypothetical protein